MVGTRVILLLVAITGLIAVYGLTWVSKRIEHIASGVRPLPPRDFERFTVIALGSAGDNSNHLRRGPSVGIGRGTDLILVDAGRGVSESLRASGIPVSQSRTLLLTSLLPENTVGIDDLLAARSLDPTASPLTVVGPPGTSKLVEGLWKAHLAGLQARQLGLSQSLSQMEPRTTETSGASRLQVGPIAVSSMALEGGPLLGLAFRCKAAGKAILVSSSGWAPETLVEFGNGVDVWIHEAIYRESLESAIKAGASETQALREEAARHTALEDIGSLATRMDARILVLTRLRPPPVFDFQYSRLVSRAFDGRVIVATDGETVTP